MVDSRWILALQGPRWFETLGGIIKNVVIMWCQTRVCFIKEHSYNHSNHPCISLQGIRSTECAVSTAGIFPGKRATPTRAASGVETWWGWPQLNGNTQPREPTQREGFLWTHVTELCTQQHKTVPSLLLLFFVLDNSVQMLTQKRKNQHQPLVFYLTQGI